MQVNGYYKKCVCKNSRCTGEKLPNVGCKTIAKCVKLGKCKKDEPCSCEDGVCGRPWYFKNMKGDENCHKDEDCENTLNFN